LLALFTLFYQCSLCFWSCLSISIHLRMLIYSCCFVGVHIMFFICYCFCANDQLLVLMCWLFFWWCSFLYVGLLLNYFNLRFNFMDGLMNFLKEIMFQREAPLEMNVLHKALNDSKFGSCMWAKRGWIGSFEDVILRANLGSYLWGKGMNCGFLRRWFWR